jgi:hypothetical protein
MTTEKDSWINDHCLRGLPKLKDLDTIKQPLLDHIDALEAEVSRLREALVEYDANIAKRLEQYQHEGKVLSKKPTVDPIKRTHLEQMLSYINARDREGWYYGQITHFDKRQVEIVAWIADCLEKLR